MQRPPREEDREERMRLGIVVDAPGAEERAMRWYHYLTDTLAFPFITQCRAKRAISPLQIGDEVDVIGMAPEEECWYPLKKSGGAGILRPQSRSLTERAYAG